MNPLPFLLERDNDRPISGAWHLPEGPAKGTVLFLHGYKGYMDWGAWPQVGNLMASQGWRFLRINFTHNGTTPVKPSSFNDLEAFAANTYRRERDEAVDVLKALRNPASVKDTIASDAPLVVIGHSRGGGIACLAGAAADCKLRQTGRHGVDAIVTWAGVSDFASRFPTGAQLEDWRKTGQLEVINHRTRQRLHHNWSFFQDFQENESDLTIENAVRKFKGRMMVAHGTNDVAVAIEHAHQLNQWSTFPTLALLEGAGHTFGAAEPWQKPILPEQLQVLTQTTLHFMEEGRAVQ